MSADQSEAIAFLADPATHGGGAVERIDTHGAIVFLAGERAYKLKRAVAYPYMDFSTLERRRAACEAEVALNRRTAPMIYRRAAALARGKRGLAFDGPGEIVDWVVVMRRFAQDDLFDRLAESGRLTPALMEDLAGHVARFHASAERHPEIGGAQAIAIVLDINRDELARHAGLLPAGAAQAIDARCRAAAGKLGALLDRRAREGHVRRCHGDLHLRNICLIDGAPVLFDAIEFNDRLAVIDTLYDLAFLLMDLEHRGSRALANVAFNRYVEESGDIDGLAALGLFMALRAAVRAHVAASAGAQGEAREYADLALKLLDDAPARIVAMGGLSGSGKSTIARALAPDLGPAPGALVLRTDVVRKRLAGVATTAHLPDEAYTEERIAAIYAAMEDLAERAVRAGRSVIVDGVYAKPAEREAIESLAHRLGSRFDGFWLDAPAEMLEARIRARARDASDATVWVLRKQLAYDLGPIAWRRLDARGDIAGTARAARTHLI